MIEKKRQISLYILGLLWTFNFHIYNSHLSTMGYLKVNIGKFGEKAFHATPVSCEL